MAGRYHTPGGWTVEVLQLPAGDRLRIRHHGFYVADVVNADDLARWIPAAELAQLERDTLILAASPRRPSFRFPAHAAACATPTNTPRPGTGRSDAPVPPPVSASWLAVTRRPADLGVTV